jgi:hypothetical protein
MELPSEEEYSDYYQVIKQPIALDTIKVLNNVDAFVYKAEHNYL